MIILIQFKMYKIKSQITALTIKLGNLPKEKRAAVILKIQKLKKQLEDYNKRNNWTDYLAN